MFSPWYYTPLSTAGHAPFRDFIRQLLVLSLYPLARANPVPSDTSGSTRTAIRKATGLARFVTSPAVDAANEALRAFADSVPLAHMLSSIPSYDDPPVSLSVGHTMNVPRHESLLAAEADRISNIRCCWDMLKNGFIPAPSHNDRDMPEFAQEHDACIGSSAWPALGWIVRLFSQDERETLLRTGDQYSPLLLRHIPSTLTSRHLKWDVTVPLRIALYGIAVDKTHAEACGVSEQLLKLVSWVLSYNDRSLAQSYVQLCNLAAAGKLDQDLFINAISKQFPTEDHNLNRLLTTLPPRLRFLTCSSWLQNHASDDDAEVHHSHNHELPSVSGLSSTLRISRADDPPAPHIKYHLLATYWTMSRREDKAAMSRSNELREAVNVAFHSCDILRDAIRLLVRASQLFFVPYTEPKFSAQILQEL
ncbi:unnamed protein product [Peniophora sp. CBMAI 1063]|nr:unnamed protein product [Peniophora sp. CBMAI 1063]